MKIIDTRGEVCPKPIIMTKKELLEIKLNETFCILTDNETSLANLMKFLSDNKIHCEIDKKDGYYSINATKKEMSQINAKVNDYCNLTPANQNLVVFKSDKMGSGDDALGSILIKGFINTLLSLEHKPEAIIFYNSGVLLTSCDSPVSDNLKKLQDQGTKLIICGTCVDFYHLKEKVKIGTISNMLDICEKLASANRIIYP